MPDLWPRNPELPPEVLAELERRGVDSVRATMASAENITRNPSQQEAEAWLKWKAARAWIKAGAVTAAVAAIFAGISWLLPLRDR